MDPLLVVAAGDALDPLLVLQVPLDGFTDAGIEGFGGFPTEFAVDLGGIDGIPLIVARAVRDIGDLIAVGLAIRSRREIIEHRTQGVDDLKVGFFIPAADVVGFPHASRFQYAADGGAMVLYIEPIADLLAIAVNRQRFPRQGIVDDEWNQLFREMMGP